MTPSAHPLRQQLRRKRLLRRSAWTLGALSVLGGVFAIGARFGADRVRARDAWADGRLLSQAIDSVRANALDSLPSEELIRRAVAGMLRELHDPYAALLRPEGYSSYRSMLLGESHGLGMSLRMQGARLTVRSVADGSPAATAGVKRGDRILSWNGVVMSDWRTRTTADSTRMKGDSARLVLWRAPVGDTVDAVVRKATWHMPAVTESGLLSDSVGYVRLASISQRSSDELEDAVERLVRKGARSLMIDLRGNGGGLFEEGVKVAGLFLPPNLVVASLAGRGSSPSQVYRSKHARWPSMPLAVLVDASTASSAEVIAAALREHKRALLIGAPTYGKGVVQRVVRLSPDLSLRLTTARWLTPSGASLERRQGAGAAATGGLLPDVTLDDPSWRDPSGIPRDWSAASTTTVLAAADSATALAIREHWDAEPVAQLESRLRSHIATHVPRDLTSDSRVGRWVSVATRLATVRMLEVEGKSAILLRYTMREDAAMRAGFDVLAPGVETLRVLPSALSTAPLR